ncbi:MAG: hypothetical protein R6U32_04790 [Candidatus Woesearchaeota archaeon]
MAGFDFNAVLNKVKGFFRSIPDKLKALPDKIKALPETVKNAPPDEQAAYGAVGLGSLLFITGLILIIVT